MVTSADGIKEDGGTGGMQTCTTTFMELARNTSGMDVLVQAIQRAGLANALPSPGAGLTVFAPTNAAFLAMMQALRECPSRPCPPVLLLSHLHPQYLEKV